MNNIDHDQQEFSRLLSERAAITHALTILDFDAETTLPADGADGFAATVGVLSGHSYRSLVNDQTGELLSRLLAAKDQLPLHLYREAEELTRQRQRLQALSEQEYREFRQLCSSAGMAWLKAKQQSDFYLFSPYLERLVESSRRFAAAYDSSRPVYDVLLDEYERGLTTAALDEFFAQLKKELLPLVQRIAGQAQPDTAWLQRGFPCAGQQELARYLMELLGLPKSRCALAQSEHPFSTAANNRDVRITTKYHEEDVLSSLFSVLHEGGHALYMLNMRDELNGLSLAEGASCSIHESQSRLYENMLGRSRGFLTFLHPQLCRIFPQQMENVSADDLYLAANLAAPSLIRIDADELTYPLHIIIRYEIEQQLFNGELKVADLPQRWNELYKQYLGLDVPDDKRGVLQDMHWSDASFGYFPTYALGSAYAAQILAAMRRELDVDDLLQQGSFTPITAWLRQKLFCFGGIKTPSELLNDICHEDFQSEYYISYLKEKFCSIYSLDEAPKKER